MVVAVDTSFLFALYRNDTHSARALDWLKNISDPVAVTLLTDFEFGNALRLAVFRRVVARDIAEAAVSLYNQDFQQGRLMKQQCELDDVMWEADRLSKAHTLGAGHRGFDILHVAAAKVIGATHFLTFDANQKSLAEKEGFTVPF